MLRQRRLKQNSWKTLLLSKCVNGLIASTCGFAVLSEEAQKKDKAGIEKP